jgi:hypothetical protein
MVVWESYPPSLSTPVGSTAKDVRTAVDVKHWTHDGDKQDGGMDYLDEIHMQ